MDLAEILGDVAVFLFDAVVAYANTDNGNAELLRITALLENENQAQSTANAQNDQSVVDVGKRIAELAQQFVQGHK